MNPWKIGIAGQNRARVVASSWYNTFHVKHSLAVANGVDMQLRPVVGCWDVRTMV